MIHTETKFAYRHKPTNQWCYIDICQLNNKSYMHFIPEFDSAILYSARNIIEEDLLRSTMNGERYAALNFLEFELVEIEVEYRLKA